MAKRFNVRVYGLLLNDGRVLVTRELIKGSAVTKFPGGGLEFGEGLTDCLRREFREELGIEVEIKHHFYTTDFFVASAFDPESQVISVYYMVTAGDPGSVLITDEARNDGLHDIQWIRLGDLSEQDLSLVIDKKVAAMLRAKYALGDLC